MKVIAQNGPRILLVQIAEPEPGAPEALAPCRLIDLEEAEPFQVSPVMPMGSFAAHMPYLTTEIDASPEDIGTALELAQTA